MMRENKSKDRSSSFSRRRFLIATGLAGAATSAVADTAVADTNNRTVYYGSDESFAKSAYQQEEYYYSYSYDDWYRIDFTVKGLGGYSKSNGMWGTTFRNHAYGARRRYDPSYDNPKDDPDSMALDTLEGHELAYADADDGNNSTFGYKYDTGYLGGYPNPEYTALEAAESTVEELGKIAIQALNPVADLALSAAELYQNISDSKDNENSNTIGENQTFAWTYGTSYMSDKQSDVTQYNEIDYEQEYDCVSTFYTESTMSEGSVSPSVSWKVQVESPQKYTTSSSSSTAGTSSSETTEFSPETIEEFGLRKVSIGELKNKGIELVDPLIVDGNKTWWSPKVKGSISLVPESETPFPEN